MRNGKELLALVALLAVMIAIATFSFREESNPFASNAAPQRSSYHSSSQGYKAAMLTMQALDIPVHRQIRPFSLLPASGALLVADPTRTPVSVMEGRALLHWVRRGNHALIFLESDSALLAALTGFETAVEPQPQGGAPNTPLWLQQWDKQFYPQRLTPMEMLETVASGKEPPEAKISTARAIAPTFFTQRAPTLHVKSLARFPEKHPLPAQVAARFSRVTPVYADARGIVAVYAQSGKGGMLFCSSPWTLANQGISEGHNLDLLLAMVDTHPSAPLIFDEYHHGYGANMSVWNLAPAKVKLGIAHVALALALLVALLSWRFGAIRLPAEDRYTRSRAEYLASMAGLLQRARASSMVAQRLHAQLSGELARRLRMPAHAPLPALLAANDRFPVVERGALARVAQQLALVQAQPRPDIHQLLRLARDVHQLLQRERLS